jgi:hypothetical protein
MEPGTTGDHSWESSCCQRCHLALLTFLSGQIQAEGNWHGSLENVALDGPVFDDKQSSAKWRNAFKVKQPKGWQMLMDYTEFWLT